MGIVVKFQCSFAPKDGIACFRRRLQENTHVHEDRENSMSASNKPQSGVFRVARGRGVSQSAPISLLLLGLPLLGLLVCACLEPPSSDNNPTPQASPTLAPDASPTDNQPTPTGASEPPNASTPTPASTPAPTPAPTPEGGEDTPFPPSGLADVVSVAVSGDAESYDFAVGVFSPDTGCDKYANWWEVVTVEGELVYRRILTHSHVDEQPFVRGGGPVAIGLETRVIVRAHLEPGGYGGRAFEGSVSSGFKPVDSSADFAAELESAEPQPTGCAF